MTSYNIYKLISAAIGICGGLIFMVHAVQYRNVKKQWVTRSLFLAGALALLWGGAVLFLALQGGVMGLRTVHLVNTLKTLVGGIVIGVFLVLFISGEFSLKKISR